MRSKSTRHQEAQKQQQRVDNTSDEPTAELGAEELVSGSTEHLLATNRALSEHLETAKAVAAERKARLNAAEREVAGAEEKAERHRTELAETLASLDDIQLTNRDLESQNARLLEELEKLVAVAEDYEQSVAELRDEISSVTSESKARLSRLESSEVLVADLVRANSDMQTDLASQRDVSDGAERAARGLEVEILDLRNVVDAADCDAAEQAAAAERVQAALDEALGRHSKLEERFEALTAQAAGDADRITKGEQAIVDLSGSANKLRDELRDAEEAARSAADQRVEVAERLEKVLADEARAARAVADLEEENRRLSDEVGEFREAATSAIALNEELEAQLEQARTEAAGATKRVAELEALSEAQLTTITGLEGRLEEIENKLADSTEDADLQRQRAGETDQKVQRLKADLRVVHAALGHSAAAATSTLESARGQLRAADRELMGAIADIRMEVAGSQEPVRKEDLLEVLSSDATLLVLHGDALAVQLSPNAGVAERRDVLVRALTPLAANHPASIEVAFDGNVLATPPALDNDAEIRVRLTRVGVSAARAMLQIIENSPFGSQILVVADPETGFESRRDYQVLPMATLMSILPEVTSTEDQQVARPRSPELAVVESGSESMATSGADAREDEAADSAVDATA